MKRILAGLAILVVLGVLGYFGFSRYQQYRFVEAISLPIKNTSLRLVNVSVYETRDDSQITFKELFDKLESDIGEIDKRILDVQTIASPSKRSSTDLAVEYMRGCQGLLRSLLAKYRKTLSLNSASRAYEAAQEALSSRGDLSLYKLEALEKALKGRKKAAEELSESVSDVLSSAKYLKDALASVAAVLPADTLVDASLLDAIQKKNDRKAGNKPSPTNAAPVATGSKGGEQDPTPAPYGLGRPSSTVPKEREPPPAPRAAPARRAAPSPTDQADDAEDERLRKQREQWQAEAEREQRKAEPEKGRRRDNDIERLLDTHTVGKKPKGDDADPFQ